MKVLLIGPSVERTKGGMATVIQSELDSARERQGYSLEHLVTHVDGHKGEKFLYFIKALLRLIVLRNIRIAHIHVASGPSFYRKSLFVYLCRAKKIPVIMHIHGHEFDQFFTGSSARAKRFIRKTFLHCKKVLVLSDYWFDFFCREIVSENVEVLRNGVDVSLFSQCAAGSDKLRKFLFLGRLGQRKGVYDLLEAARIVVHTHKLTGVQFYLAGDGDLKEVEAVIKKSGLEKNVFLLGWLDDKLKQECLKAVYTVVLPSYSEGLPMSLLEAMAAGKVILSTTVGGIPELVEDGENGFLVQPGDSAALVRNILYICSHKEKMEQISRNNKHKVYRHYNAEYLNDRLYQIYGHVATA